MQARVKVVLLLRVESMQAAFASPEAQAASADVVNFLDLSRFQMLMVAEQEVPLSVEVTA
jgi:hypothetical protein